ncbi:unnamed protein product [Cunninghamella echinulata]
MGPARKQISKETLDTFIRERRPEGGTYNIWHHRYTGGERDWSRKGAKAKFRCDPDRDSGITSGTRNPNAYFCVYFAKGMCAQGEKCPMLHRVPTLEDEVETTIDCFGRDKHSDFRQDMGGIGGFSSTNRTLYVGRITDVNEETVRKHFSLWGEIKRIHILRNRGVAFVDYKSRASAEFAKEAMMGQSLDNNETINVRWATETQLRRDRIFEEIKNSKLLKFDDEPGISTSYGPDNEYQQEYESELPAEFSTMKRSLEDDDLEEIKRQKRIEDLESENNNNNQYIYDQDTTRALYGYTYDQQQHYQEYYNQQPINNNNNNNNSTAPIISQNVLQSLKSLSGNKPVSTSTSNTKPTSSQPIGGLGGLANYGSDSESDDEQ